MSDIADRREAVTGLIVQARDLITTIASKMDEIQKLLSDPDDEDTDHGKG